MTWQLNGYTLLLLVPLASIVPNQFVLTRINQAEKARKPCSLISLIPPAFGSFIDKVNILATGVWLIITERDGRGTNTGGMRTWRGRRGRVETTGYRIRPNGIIEK